MGGACGVKVLPLTRKVPKNLVSLSFLKVVGVATAVQHNCSRLNQLLGGAWGPSKYGIPHTQKQTLGGALLPPSSNPIFPICSAVPPLRS